MPQRKPHIPVSLILTTLNEESAVEEFFASVAASTALPDEIVVCDGGSSDRTVELLQDIRIEGTQIRVLTEEDATIARGRNTAVQHAKHDVLAISDFGCKLDANWLELITQPLLTNETVDAVAGGYRLEGRTFFERCSVASQIPVHKLNPETFLPSSRSFAVRKTAFIEAGMYPEHLTFAGEDTALVVALKQRGKKMIVQWDAQVTWYPRSSLSALIKQYYLYGLGDGESGLNPSRYPLLGLKIIAGIALVIASIFLPMVRLILPVLFLLYFAYLWPKYDWRQYPFGVALCGYALIYVKDSFLVIGYLRGLMDKRTIEANRLA
ncbi:MAG: hypothetical protein CL946_13765 [Ectothiorhodospiraceae bacterium]|nr:hypothetical protein [Ectothiorhodospiraceae bacterium]